MYYSQSNNMPRESENILQSLISQFYSKSLHTIIASRVPSSLHSHRRSPLKTTVDERFRLLLSGDPPAAIENLNYWHNAMIIDIFLVQKGTTTTRSSSKTVLERWIIKYDYSPPVWTPQSGYYRKAYQTVYQRLIILFRSLHSQMRLLPLHNIFRWQSTSMNNTFNFDIAYQISSFSDPFSGGEEKMMKQHNFKPVEAFPGRLSISVTYRTSLADLKLDEFLTHRPPKIMKDYVGNPNISPVMIGLRPMRPPVVTVKHHPRTTSDFQTDVFGDMIPGYSNLTRPSTPMQTHQLPLAADPTATIYPSGTGKGSINFSHNFSDSSENLTRKSINDSNSLRKSSSGNMSSKNMDAHRAGVVHSRTVNYGVQKMGNKDHSLSSYPFYSAEPSQNANDMVRKSQKAALGVLVHKLRVTRPLQQNRFLPRKMDDSLQELRNYKIMGDRLSKI